MGVIGLSTGMFALAFAVSSCGTLLGALLSGRLNARGVSSAAIVNAGVIGMVASAAALLLVALAGAAQVGTIVPLVALAIFCFGLIGPNANHAALSGLPQVAGSASGVLRCTQMVLGATASALVAWLQPLGQPLLVMAILMIATSLAAAACLLRLRAGDRHDLPKQLKEEPA
jgi:DHA1 family bicyclomycin/chloramphenicol resistance-like MFS transporter